MLSREARHDQRPSRPVVRPLIRGATALAAVCLALAGAGCGSDSDDEDAGQGSAETSLEVTLDVDGEGGEAARTETVACESQVDCEGAEGLSTTGFEPVPAATACTEIFGGPETASVVGTLSGDPVEAQFSRANGCEIERFDQFVPLLQSLFPDYMPGEALTP